MERYCHFWNLVLRFAFPSQNKKKRFNIHFYHQISARSASSSSLPATGGSLGAHYFSFLWVQTTHHSFSISPIFASLPSVVPISFFKILPSLAFTGLLTRRNSLLAAGAQGNNDHCFCFSFTTPWPQQLYTITVHPAIHLHNSHVFYNQSIEKSDYPHWICFQD